MPTINFKQEAMRQYMKMQPSEEELREAITMIGTDVESFGEEISVEIFPNRPDLLSVAGLARAVDTYLGSKRKHSYKAAKDEKYQVHVEKAVEGVRDHISCAVVENLQLDADKIDEIIELQEKLHVTFGRKRKKVAIGIYPLEKISWPVTYTARKPQEIKFQPLQATKEMSGKQILDEHETGKKYSKLLEKSKLYPLIVDKDNKVLSMPPIINSKKVGEVAASTKDVFVECTGPQREPLEQAIKMIACALADMGGSIKTVQVNYAKWQHQDPDMSETIIEVDLEQISSRASIPKKDIAKSLEKMGLKLENNTVKAPCYRNDFLHPIDVLEDAAIGYGYENIQAQIPSSYTIGSLTQASKNSQIVASILAGMKYQEVMSYLLTDQGIELANPLTQEFRALRGNIIDNLLSTLASNTSNEYPQRIFEIGTVFEKADTQTGVKETLKVAALQCQEPSTFSHARETVQAIAQALKLDLNFEKANDERFISGRCAKITGDAEGIIGEINPKMLSERNILFPTAGFEINL